MEYIIGVIVGVIIIYTILTYNSFAKLKIRVEEGFSTMDVYLKKRWDLIPNLVETVKGYIKHEKDLLTEITKIRKVTYDNMTTNEKINTNNELSSKISRLFAIAENYPELKSSDNFITLSEELTQVEEDIANARKYYNGTVRNLNEKIVTFPSNIIGKIFGFKKEKMFEATDEERTNVKINI